jgi:hypothetical protein
MATTGIVVAVAMVTVWDVLREAEVDPDEGGAIVEGVTDGTKNVDAGVAERE